ncbi:MAG TPA: ABC transporter ATP-binding protein [Planctomycetota bacterium]|nr:ABC transporter ATP-binding protein [Planctomycetota bacterium]
MTPPALLCLNLHLTYGTSVRALDGVSLSVSPGEFVSVIGPNGSGKSSLLRASAGLLQVDSGEIRLNGTLIHELSTRDRARRVALVPQNLAVLPGYSVEDFVLMGRYAHLTGWRLFTSADREMAREHLRQVEALDFLNRGMDEMSGGERQRVLIARALTQESEIVLLDEPTSALDLKHQVNVYRLIQQMRKAGRTIVVVTHDLNLASQFSDRLVLMKGGRIVMDGKPDDVLKPDVLNGVYETELAFGCFETSAAGTARPWVLPWAKA